MKGIMLFSDRMEDVEALGTRALLKRAGIEIDTATFNETLKVETAFNLEVKADCRVQDEIVDNYDFIVLPGGPYVAQTVDRDEAVKNLVKAFDAQGKLVAAICAGPRFLGQAGLLDGKTFTAFTNSEKDAPKGKYRPKQKALRDENIITARGAGAVYEFAYEIVKYLQGEDAAKKLLRTILH